MSRLLLSLFLTVFLLVGCTNSPRDLPLVPPATVGLSADKLALVDGVMNKLVTDKKIAGGVVVVARHGQIALLKAFGQRELESGSAMATDTIFRIYSMSKSITSVAVLMLAEEGKLKLDQPVGAYIPELANLQVYHENGPIAAKRQPTISDLLRHTAGFTYGNGGGPVDKLYKQDPPMKANNLDEFAQKLGKLPLAFEPGTDWVYSVSIDVAGLVVQRVSGQPLNEFIRVRILEPLNMSDTGFHVPEEKLSRFAAIYDSNADGLKRSDVPSKYAKLPTMISGGGGLVSTARDYLRFLMMIRNGGTLDGIRLLKTQSVQLMTTNQLPEEAFPIYFGKQIRHGTGHGLGFSVRTADTQWDPAGRIGEYGWGGAASTHYWTSPKDDVIVITLEQRMPYNFETEVLLKGLIYDAIVK